MELDPHDAATVYIYRPSAGLAAAGWPNIFVDGQQHLALKNKGYGVVYLDPGEHTVLAKGDFLTTDWQLRPTELTETFEPSQVYYIRISPIFGSVESLPGSGTYAVDGNVHMSIVPEAIAFPEIVTTRSVQNDQYEGGYVGKLVFLGIPIN